MATNIYKMTRASAVAGRESPLFGVKYTLFLIVKKIKQIAIIIQLYEASGQNGKSEGFQCLTVLHPVDGDLLQDQQISIPFPIEVPTSIFSAAIFRIGTVPYVVPFLIKLKYTDIYDTEFTKYVNPATISSSPYEYYMDYMDYVD
jgi:hypothetical protein